MTSAIQLIQVTRSYQNIEALKGVDLEVSRGEHLTIVGPNGSGKTTLLKIIACLIKPTSGELYFNGLKIDNSNRSLCRKKVTMVFQQPVLFNTNVYNNIAYGLKVEDLSKTEIDKKVNEALELVKLQDLTMRHANQLSGGEKQRVSLARAIILDKEVLLLDEPTANLDPASVNIIEDAINVLKENREKTVITATHNMFQAEKLADKLALLMNGMVAETGYTNELFNRPSKIMASFTVLENKFTGNSRIDEDGLSVVDIGEGIEIKTTAKKSGRITIHIQPVDLIISKELFESSARNRFKGKIVSVSDLGSIVKLKVDIGREFVIQITNRSYKEMGLNVDSEVYVTFKASSVSVI
jgi:tungstate transport system ATP-binding protein